MIVMSEKERRLKRQAEVCYVLDVCERLILPVIIIIDDDSINSRQNRRIIDWKSGCEKMMANENPLLVKEAQNQGFREKCDVRMGRRFLLPVCLSSECITFALLLPSSGERV